MRERFASCKTLQPTKVDRAHIAKLFDGNKINTRQQKNLKAIDAQTCANYECSSLVNTMYTQNFPTTPLFLFCSKENLMEFKGNLTPRYIQFITWLRIIFSCSIFILTFILIIFNALFYVFCSTTKTSKSPLNTLSEHEMICPYFSLTKIIYINSMDLLFNHCNYWSGS
jgi:hypothetical protein